ncbi:gliding motility lipoprotein GldB [Aquimarina sp. W85]|uniref:gliding motility lipoprotein GldB n=2 Tax=Aquimarina rhodophyticola TaxID=3342246 RepID=UPI00366B3926
MALYRSMTYLYKSESVRDVCVKIKLFCLFFIVLASCNKEDKLEREIRKIPVEVRIERFDSAFSSVTPRTLPLLKQQYPFLFPEKYKDSFWMQKVSDTLQIELTNQVAKKFTDLTPLKADLEALLQHAKYYFPEITVPRVITITNDVDYHNKIILSDNLLLIALDTYLGDDHYFYESIQQYIKRNFTSEQIIPDVATVYAKQLVSLSNKRTFLSNLIYYGKVQYLIDLFLPSQKDYVKFGYTLSQLEWVQANEEQIWRYFIDKEMLYSTEADLSPRFLYPAPFSKFYLEEIDKEAPDRIGRYMGWRIVTSYMKNNNVSLRQLLIMDAETVFNKSKYKPRN